ncbi:hypothetical protein [Chryseosolibacter indicus]|uniref:Uncharacterized protein n=1 Tax=Chryseosolibacter indicus TaxID=2782351 RepID=A0ABS5VUK9_9BACT|nr:hypothetical protein [Chryseosolibacter indicus]MBT1705021.1 hypothetical protein [Chryseosolibacter indicus]
MKASKNKISKIKKGRSKSSTSAPTGKTSIKKNGNSTALVEDQGNKLTLEDASILQWERDRKKSKGADEEL